MRPYEFPGGVAVVTGAASGIGRALALDLAARGSHLALVDRDAAGLKATASALESLLCGRKRLRRPQGRPYQSRSQQSHLHQPSQPNRVRVSLHVLDLGEGEVAGLERDVLDAHGRVTLLVNNAGVALGGSFEELSIDEYEWLMNINFRAVVRLTKAFLPTLLREEGAHLVNLSSVFGLVAPPGQSAYAASKFAVRGFSEALRHELEGRSGVTVVHPGGVKTNIALGARISAGTDVAAARESAEWFTEGLKTAPEEAAATILRAVERRQGRVLIGSDALIIDTVQRLLPVSYWRVLGALAGDADVSRERREVKR